MFVSMELILVTILWIIFLYLNKAKVFFRLYGVFLLILWIF